MKITKISAQSTNDNKKMTIFIDGTPYKVSADNNLLAGILSEKLNLPYFCWHPSMGSVGACRQCAVTQFQDENDTRGRLVMACTTPVTEGMRIGLNEEQSAKFREQVIAGMMTNHPHDCPVCAEGGECHLQDMTVMTGHSAREYRGKKRTFTNQHLGEFVGHEMNRCITCYRCLRYYKDYAGGKDFGVYGSRNQVYFGRQQEGQLESEFSGNLVEVCPTGVFTNKLFSAHYARKWDLQSAPSVCSFCSVGCNTSVGERYGSVRRVMNRYDHDLNGYFICDKGRFGIGFVNNEQRIKRAKGITQQSPARLTRLDVAKALSHYKGKTFIGVGSARASMEGNYYLQQLVGSEHFSAGFTSVQMSIAAAHQAVLAKHKAPSIKDIEQSDFILIIDEDVTQTAGRIALAIRQALRNASVDKASLIGIPHWQDSAVRTIGGSLLTPLFQLTSKGTKLDDVARQSLLISPQSILALTKVLINTLTKVLNDGLTEELQYQKVLETLTEFSALPTKQQDFIRSLLQAFHQAKNPLIIGGWSAQSAQMIEKINSLLDVSSSFGKKAQGVIIPPQSNSVGLMSLTDKNTLSVEQILMSAKHEKIDGLIFLEQELNDFTQVQLHSFKAANVVVIALDHSESKVTQLADIVLPVATVTESDGNFVNYQGRVQQFSQVHPTVLPIQENWRWLSLLANSIFPANPLAKEVESLTQLQQLFADSSEGNQWGAFSKTASNSASRKVARETHRVSGRTAKMANTSVHEIKTTQSHTYFSFSMEGSLLQGKGKDNMPLPFTWAPGWNSNQSITQFQQQIGEQLIDSIEQSFIDFSAMPIDVPDDEVLATNNRVQTNQESLVISLQVPWYRSNWQANLTPEFTLMKHANSLFMAEKQMLANNWQQGDWLTLKLVLVDCNDDSTTKNVETIAQLNLDEQIGDDHLYGDIDLPIGSQIESYTLQAATEKQKQSYQDEFNHKQQQALDQKEKILIRLKSQDQMIPIRLVSGGLDDV